MHLARIGHYYVAGDQLRTHKLMHRGGGGMYPAQLLGQCKLIGPQREAYKDIGIANFGGYVIVIRRADDFGIREILAEPRRKPRRLIPQTEAMVNGDEYLHRFEAVASGTRRFWPVISLGWGSSTSSS